MSNINSVTTSSMLNVIFENYNFRNLDLMIPFVKNIVYNSADKECTILYIQEELERKYMFEKFPLSLLRQILNYLKRKEVLILKNNSYEFLHDCKKEMEKFEKTVAKANDDNEFILKNIQKYMKNEAGISLSPEKTDKYFSLFLKNNGYDILDNPIKINKLDGNVSQIMYNIGQMIFKEYQNNSKIFKKILRITEGFFIASTIYIQTDKPEEALKNVEIYLDAPFLLRVLGYKTIEENQEARELISILQNQCAKLKCFNHNVDEVEGILKHYIDNRFRGNYMDKTLEGLDEKHLSAQALNLLHLKLEENILSEKIEIVDTPPYEKDKTGKYSNIIGEEKLIELLKQRYEDDNPNDEMIRRDVKSISAINRIRKGKKIKKLEDSKAIFLTTNKKLTKTVNDFLNINEEYQIGLSMTILNLTAIAWITNVRSNKELIKSNLISNARAVLEPTPEIIKKFLFEVRNIKDNENITKEDFKYLIRSGVYRTKLMENVEGNEQQLNAEVIVSTYEQTSRDNEKYLSIMKKSEASFDKLQTENSQYLKQLKEYENKETKKEKNINTKSSQRATQFEKIITSNIIIISSILVILCIMDMYSNYKENALNLFSLLGGVSVIAFIVSVTKLYFSSFKKRVRNYIEKFIKKQLHRKINRFN